MNRLFTLAYDLLNDTKHTRWIAPCLILVETVLCAAIVTFIPCQSHLHASNDPDNPRY